MDRIRVIENVNPTSPIRDILNMNSDKFFRDIEWLKPTCKVRDIKYLKPLFEVRVKKSGNQKKDYESTLHVTHDRIQVNDPLKPLQAIRVT